MKKLLPLFLALLFLLTLPASAAAGKLTATAATSGKTATVVVDLKNPGIIATRIFVRYDSKVLKLERAENGKIFADNKATFGKDITDNPYVMLWDDGMRRDNITDSGTLCTLTFTITGGTPNGKTNVRIAIDQASTFDVNINEVTVEDCSVLVDVPVVESSSAAQTTTKAAGTTTVPAAHSTLPTPSTTKAGASATQSAKTSAPATKAPITASAGTTKAGTTAAGTTKAAAPAQTSAVQPVAPQSTSAAATAQEGAGATSTAAAGTPDATAANATVPDGQPETVPDLLTSAFEGETAAQNAEIATQAQPEAPTEARSSGAKYLLLLLIIPVAVVVVLVIKKKK